MSSATTSSQSSDARPRAHLAVLGPLLLDVGGDAVDVRGQQRRLLAWLTMHRAHGLRVDRLADRLWTDRFPADPRREIRRLVRQLGDVVPGLAITGDLVQLPPVTTDVDEFDDLVATRAAGDQRALHRALELWRGDPYIDLGDHPDAVPEVHRLSDARLRLLEAITGIALLGGEIVDATADLQDLVVRFPERATLVELLAIALALAGRRVESIRHLAALPHGGAARPELLELEHAIQVDDLDVVRRVLEARLRAR